MACCIGNLLRLQGVSPASICVQHVFVVLDGESSSLEVAVSSVGGCAAGRPLRHCPSELRLGMPAAPGSLGSGK